MSETIFRHLWSSYLLTRLTIHFTIHFTQVMISTFVLEIIMFCIYVISVNEGPHTHIANGVEGTCNGGWCGGRAAGCGGLNKDVRALDNTVA